MSAVTSGLFAALRLARGRSDGIVLVANDRSTVRRSFWAIPFALPAIVVRLAMEWAETGVPTHSLHAIGRELMVFVLGWLLFVEATHWLVPMIGRAERWGRFIAVWNWCNVIEGLLVVVGAIPGTLGAPAIIDQACDLIMIGWALWLEWYAIRLTLGIGLMTAVWLVLLDQSIGVFLGSLALAISP